MIQWTDEAELGRPFWWDRAGLPVAETPPEETCDILVIGAGYAGMSAAIAAQDCGAKVTVVDAGTPGQGASTRNGGMFGAHPRLGWDALAVRFGPELADRLFAEAAPALAWARDLIEREGIDCDLQDTGRIQLAWTRSHFEAQKRLARHVAEKSAVRVQVIERERLPREIGTESYFGGLLFPEHCAVDPVKYHSGLFDAALRRDVSVTGGAPVEALERGTKGFVAQTKKGQVRADKVILCTNGYTGAPFGWLARRVFPLPSYLIATEELPANLIGQLAPGRRMMVETRIRHSYFRISPDGKRILFGGRASMRNVPLDVAAERLKETMCGIWPELEEVRLSHVWTGNTGFSFNQMPCVGERDGLHYAAGFSGSGTVMAPYLGAKAAYRAVGDARGDTAYALTALKSSPLHPFEKPHFLYAADLWYRHWVDRRENRWAR